MTEQELIKSCKAQHRKAQQSLYDRYAPVLFGICRRYVKQHEDAEDVLLEVFYKIFTNIKQYKGKGSFEGWIKRIAVNESLMFLRKKRNFNISVDVYPVDVREKSHAVDELLFEKDILVLLEKLPTGYRTIFNLYVVEGYKHREIADKLGISINTSKSQLILAKKRMSELLKKNNIAEAS
jgi:RNA polymerase sigma-70 factor (ECF subfamily)